MEFLFLAFWSAVWAASCHTIEPPEDSSSFNQVPGRGIRSTSAGGVCGCQCGSGTYPPPNPGTGLGSRSDGLSCPDPDPVLGSLWDERTDHQHGCYKGYCWSGCSGGVRVFGSALSDLIKEWCYTTEGASQSYNYVTCAQDTDCCLNWKCGGPCTIG